MNSPYARSFLYACPTCGASCIDVESRWPVSSARLYVYGCGLRLDVPRTGPITARAPCGNARSNVIPLPMPLADDDEGDDSPEAA